MQTPNPNGPVRRTITPGDAMQKAVNLLMAPFPSDTELHQAQALVSLSRELRIATKHRSRAYGDVDYEVTPELPEEPQVDEPVGVDVDSPAPTDSYQEPATTPGF